MSNKKITIKPAKKKEPSPDTGEYWKVLIIDDDPGVIMITEHILKNFTFEKKAIKTYSAQSFPEAASVYDQHPDAAVAIIDVIMDTADAGLKLVKHIREECHNDKIQLILRTGQPGNMDQRDIMLGYSINDYLNKGSVTSEGLQDNLIGYLRNFEAIQKIGDEKNHMEMMLKKREEIIRLLTEEMKLSESLTAKLTTLLHENQQLSSEEQIKYIQLLLSCDEQMIYLLRDFLDSSQLERGTFNTEPTNFKLEDALSEIKSVITTLNKQLACEEKVDIAMLLDNSLPDVLFDPIRCQQIVINLLINSLNRTREGSIHIQAKVAHNYICLSLTDTGQSIAAAELQELVMPSKEAATSAKDTQIRLSLSNIKFIIEAQHGAFEVGNNLGDGAYFKLMLPIAQTSKH